MNKITRIFLIFFFCALLIWILKEVNSNHLKKKNNHILTKEKKLYDKPIMELQIPNNKKKAKKENNKEDIKEGKIIVAEDGCIYIWVIDVPYKPAIEEQGHYEIIHHEAITHLKDIYQEFKTYYFVKEDETYITVEDYEGFSPEEYFNSLPDEFYRYYYKLTKKVIGQEIVIDREAYDEKIWVVDQPYQPAVEQQGHYEKLGC
ncbi:MAG TPA: hypothetical protein PLT36_04075 [Erysipelotrichaceae bacterium]|jgi:hypothetical protein|nr:hypothetical protein [Erysipelotrichia bacterium]HPX32661.1 hypothetical protein [Erysipelotrichaceae bacterium]HQA85340.1 hypothetical protein [Erysipelotrichaceae bacterium]